MATKIVNDGRCQITYSVVDEFKTGAWRFVSVTITVQATDQQAGGRPDERCPRWPMPVVA